MNQHEKLNYVEFASSNIPATKAFFSSVFGWEFVDYGPGYTSFANQGLDGGFYKIEDPKQPIVNGTLLVFYSQDIDATLAKVKAEGGEITRPIFDFPGGCRFHFLEPSGNEFAVWSENKA